MQRPLELGATGRRDEGGGSPRVPLSILPVRSRRRPWPTLLWHLGAHPMTQLQWHAAEAYFLIAASSWRLAQETKAQRRQEPDNGPWQRSKARRTHDPSSLRCKEALTAESLEPRCSIQLYPSYKVQILFGTRAHTLLMAKRGPRSICLTREPGGQWGSRAQIPPQP